MAIVAFVGTNDPHALGVVAFLALVLAVCVVLCVVQARTTTVGFHVAKVCRVGQQLTLELEASRRTWLPAGRIDLTVACRNVMLDETRCLSVVLEPGWGRSWRFELPLDTSACGAVEVSVERLGASDPLCLIRRRIGCSYGGSYTVYPRLIDLAVPLERAPRARFSGSSYDRTRKGQDMSETFDIREYRMADPLHSIHWKLSSKMGELVVREASHPSNYDILVLVDLGRAPAGGGDSFAAEEIAAALSLTASISYDLLRQDLCHKVASMTGDRLVDTMVDAPASFDAMLDALVSMPMPATSGACLHLFDQYRRDHDFTKTVLVNGSVDEAACARMAHVTDLSVVCVGCEGLAVAESAASYALVGVPIETIEDRVRSVAI